MFGAFVTMLGVVYLMVVATYALFNRRTSGGTLGGAFFVFLLLSLMPGMYYGTFGLFLFALTGVFFVCLYKQARVRTFVLASVVAFLICVPVQYVRHQSRWSGLRAKYPFVSLTDRLAYEHRHATGATDESNAPRDKRSYESLLQLSHELTTQENYYLDNDWESGPRTRALRMVHDAQLERFVNTEGLGVGRMARISPERALTDNPKPLTIPLPAGESSGPTDSASPERFAPPMAERSIDSPSDLTTLHFEASLGFVNLPGFGYVKDRDHVAGFEPHGFIQPLRLGAPGRPVPWQITKVELVSLLKHDRPMVYVSKNLPNMNELRTAPVRELDAFEVQALEQVRQQQKQVVAKEGPGQIRMLGSIRATKQCLQCHSVERGALLGAFSYELRASNQRVPAQDPTPRPIF